MRVVLRLQLPGEVVEGVVEVSAAQAGGPLREPRPVGHAAHGQAQPRPSAVAAADTMAKSPCRAENSVKALRWPAAASGKRTSASNSSGARAVISMPWKKSAAGSVRRFEALRSTTSPPSASSTSGISALGSACATEPQTVPRLRIWKCEMKGKACASSGTSCASDWRHSTLPCVAAAPIASMPPSART